MAYIAKITDLEGSTYDLRSKTTSGILYGAVDSTSTSTAFTVTVPGVTEYYDGLTILLRNGVVTSASNFTINVNGLGGKPSYNNMTTGNPITPTNPTRDTTIFNINYTMLITYSSTLVSGGAWIMYRGYDANTNTIGYQLRTNSSLMTVTDTARYYKMYFTSANGNQWVPASVNSTNNTTSARPVNQRPIDPFGRIVYCGASTNFTSGSNLTATAIWDVYAFSLGYSFNRTGAALTLTAKRPVYLKCAPQANGSAIMDADTPIVQTLPSTEDGKIYIFLGNAYDATHLELHMVHPVYYYKSGAIRLWTNAPEAEKELPSPYGPTNQVLTYNDYNYVYYSGSFTLGNNDATYNTGGIADISVNHVNELKYGDRVRVYINNVEEDLSYYLRYGYAAGWSDNYGLIRNDDNVVFDIAHDEVAAIASEFPAGTYTFSIVKETTQDGVGWQLPQTTEIKIDGNIANHLMNDLTSAITTSILGGYLMYHEEYSHAVSDVQEKYEDYAALANMARRTGGYIWVNASGFRGLSYPLCYIQLGNVSTTLDFNLPFSYDIGGTTYDFFVMVSLYLNNDPVGESYPDNKNLYIGFYIQRALNSGDTVPYLTGITSSDVTTALGYTPYNSTNPNGYITGVSSSDVTTALGYTPYNATNPDGFITGMEIMSYGSSTWAQFIAAYQAKKVVYCRASSNSNPASGAQNRLAFMAYVNNADNPTEVEFQYYRSVNTHSASQQGDQVYVYKLTSNGSWTVTVREAMSKIVAGTGLSLSYTTDTITLNNTVTGLPAVTSSDNGKVLTVVNGAWAAETIPSAQGVSF